MFRMHSRMFRMHSQVETMWCTISDAIKHAAGNGRSRTVVQLNDFVSL